MRSMYQLVLYSRYILLFMFLKQCLLFTCADMGTYLDILETKAHSKRKRRRERKNIW
uniref:Uncharacterized protein n=1 Tax=Anguilla anguilla TaxID=7936 RepID=A0A0E9T6L5_ANGAN